MCIYGPRGLRLSFLQYLNLLNFWISFMLLACLNDLIHVKDLIYCHVMWCNVIGVIPANKRSHFSFFFPFRWELCIKFTNKLYLYDSRIYFKLTKSFLLVEFWAKSLLMYGWFVPYRIRLDTVYFCWNWKYCSKIIFKYVNSIVGPIFNEKLVKKWSLWDP